MDLSEYAIIKGKSFKRHPWELARLRVLNFFIQRCADRVTIIDIGSGDAFLSSGIAKKYPASKIMAIDINYTEEMVNLLSQKQPENLEFYTHINSIAALERIDIVILMDVLEHIENPADLLSQALKLPGISVNTKFIITVPAFQSLFAQHDRNLGHYRRYSIKELEELLFSQSLKSHHSGYCFHLLALIRWFQVINEKLFKNKSATNGGIHSWRANKSITRFITGLLWVEFKISWYLARIGIRMPGLSCYSICQPFP